MASKLDIPRAPSAKKSPPDQSHSSPGAARRDATAVNRPVRSENVLTLKVELRDIEPTIWRRFTISTRATLHSLHTVLQKVMGWTNSHLYEFRIGDRRYTDPDTLDDDHLVDLDARTTTLASFRPKVGAEFQYLYDFGDGWHHRIEVERVSPRDPKDQVPACLGGARRCPPEDCGGAGGYDNLLEVLQDRDHPEHEDLSRWAGRGFDPEKFNLALTDAVLKRRQRRRKG